MSDFDKYLDAIKKGSKELVKQTFKKGGDDAKEIFDAHLQDSEEQLKRWTALLANADITQFEFTLLLNNQITLSRMKLRTIKVIGKKSAIEFRDKLRSLFIDTAVDIFL